MRAVVDVEIEGVSDLAINQDFGLKSSERIWDASSLTFHPIIQTVLVGSNFPEYLPKFRCRVPFSHNSKFEIRFVSENPQETHLG